MEGLPAGDIQAKYKKLASEYSKLRAHVKVLKKGVLDEQAKSNELRETLKEREKSLRKGELEIDSLSFRNQQLTRRVSVLQDELETVQLKNTKKSKSKEDKAGTSQNSAQLDAGLLKEELQKKILENAQYASQLSDKIFEISQLRSTLQDYERTISETDNRYKCEIAKLKNKNQELQFALEEIRKDRLGGTPSRHPGSSHAASCNGDFLSEGGSLLGSEDALSSVDDLQLNDQLHTKLNSLEQENQKLKMEYELLGIENENLKLDLNKYISSSSKRRGDHDSGDFNSFLETSTDSEGRVTGLLGTLQVPFVLSQEVESREERVKVYFRKQMSNLNVEVERLRSQCDHSEKECEMLRLRFEVLESDRRADEDTIEKKHDTIRRLEDELHSTSHNYEEQMSVLSEHVAGLNDQLARQHDQIDHLKLQLSARRK